MKFDEETLTRLMQNGWAFTLTDKQLLQLRTCIEHAVSPSDLEQFNQTLQRVFDVTARKEFVSSTGGAATKKLSTVARRQKKAMISAIGKLDQLLDLLDQGEVLDAVMDEQYEEMRREQPGSEAKSWPALKKSLGHDLLLFRAIAVRAEIDVTRGGEDAVYRQMVRGLAALYHSATGRLPVRIATTNRESGIPSEGGNLLALCKLMGGFVHERVIQEIAANRLPKKKKRPRPPILTKIVREEIDALHKEAEPPGPNSEQYAEKGP